MAEPTLAAQLARLDAVPHPVLQRLTVAGIFQQLAKPQGAAARSRASEAALQACVGHREQVVVEESVQQLCALVSAGLWDCSAAQDALLAALQTAGEPRVTISQCCSHSCWPGAN